MATNKIVVLTTGGTIASQPDDSGRSRSGALPGEDLVTQACLPAGFEYRIDVHAFLQKPSNAITGDDLLRLQAECQALSQAEDVTGIVVTHGTDTLEETAYFLAITLPEGKPVIVTGSQRAPHEPGTDALRNLADAILVAASPTASGLGPLVVFNQGIFAAQHVRKMSSYRVDGFNAPDAGPLGYIDAERVQLTLRPQQPTGAPLPVPTQLPRVDILPAYLGASPSLVKVAVDSGATGLVIDGLGRGHVPPEWVPPIARVIERGIPVVIVSSCLSGPVHPSYEFTGSLANLQALGVLPVLGLSARKARLALALLLATDSAKPLAARLAALNQ